MPTDEVMRPYLRVSDNKRGQSESVKEQLAELDEDASERAWQLGEPYADDGISASQYAEKVRGDFTKLLADLRAGTFGASILGLWELSRFSRQVDEWAPALRLLEAASVRVWVSDVGKMYDPADPDDRATLLTGAVRAEYESAQTSRRVKRTVRQKARAGWMHGQAPYGYRREYDPETGKLLRQVIVPDEAKVIRDIFDRLEAGHTLRSVTIDLRDAGVRSRAGRPLSEQVVRGMATRDTYAGRRRHSTRAANGRGGQVYEAAWPAIVKPEQFDAVQSILNNPARRTNRDGQGRHFLSMIAMCDRCVAPMTTSQRGGEPWHYRCHANCGIQVSEELLDRIAFDVIVGYLSRPDVYEELTRSRGGSPELERVRARLAEVRRNLVELEADLAAERITIKAAGAAERKWMAEEEQLVRQERELSTPPALAAFLNAGGDIRERLEAAPMSARRAVAREVLSPDLVGQLRVGKVTTNRWCDECRKPTCVHRVLARINWHRA
ncbi:recombinase family protein [Micromonospora avicenniae]|uniref:Site-specific DNA recombinase n=1 Tax=Micromonospora avicenniae TaxID=1198245 RepID=A0A1N6YE22_9ACTN|nr:recombinase family protein [Micromonospora avicenniae]SIR12872.1 Site-specific DNA recombinase [Micromonospora avicenniae]